MVNTPEQAEQFVRYCRYPPEGERSFGPTRARPLYGDDYPATANREVITLAMVETAEAVDNVDAIVATPGLTGVYIGPSDLSAFLGCSPTDHEEPVVVAAIKRVLDAAKSAGIKPGIHCGSPQLAMRRLDEGFDLVTLSTDVIVLSGALAGLMKTMGR